MKYFLLFTIVQLFFTSCATLFGDECIKNYDLVIPVKYTPSSDSLQIGDTLWITIEADSLLFDSISMDYVDGSKIDFYDLDAATTRFDSSDWYFGDSDFIYLNRKGKLEPRVFSSGTSGLIHLIFEKEEDGNRVIEAGLIPQRTGCYNMSFTFVPDSYANKKGLVQSGCSSETVTFHLKATSNSSDNNFDILSKSTIYSEIPISEYNRLGYYSFEVHE